VTHQVTEESRKTVENAAGIGMPHEMIAVLIGVKSVKTLKKRYRSQLEMGKAKACFTIAGVAYTEAKKGVPSMVKWWTATQMGWRETVSHELAGPGGKPVAIAVAAEPELLGAYYERIRKIAADRSDPRPDKDLVRARPGGDEPVSSEDAGDS
jgi:hypothetical protein